MARKWTAKDLVTGPGVQQVKPLTTETDVTRVEPLETGPVYSEQAASRAASTPGANVQQPSQAVTVGVAPGSGRQSSTRVSAKLGDLGTFTPSERTRAYQNTLAGLEADRPDAFQSRYEGTIQNILDGILNRKAFDVTTDNNYKMLYDQMAQSYMQQGNKAMRDTIGAANAASGGYGNTYAQTVGQQAYDNYLQGLNDNNMQLMQMAYGMYSDDRANDYNKLGAVTDLDNTDYSRYRDTVGDYYRDLDYYAGQANTGWNQDYGLYSDNRNLEYQLSRDEVADRDNALNAAMKFAQSGMAVPSEFASLLGEDTVAQLNGLAAQMLAQQAAGGSGGGGGRSRRSSGNETITAEEYVNARRSGKFSDKEMKELWAAMPDTEVDRYYGIYDPTNDPKKQRKLTGR